MHQFSYRGRPALPIQTSTYVDEDGPTAWWIGDGPDTIKLSVNLVDLGFSNPEPGYVYIADYGHTHRGNAEALVEQRVCELVCRIAINEYGSKIAVMRVLPS